MWPPPSSLTADFWLLFALAWAYCGAVLALSHRYSERAFGKVFARLSPADRTLWHSYVYCIVPGTLCWCLVSHDFARLLSGGTWDARRIFTMPPTSGVLRAVGWELGFLAFDLCVMLVWRKDLIEAMQPAMYMQMVMHHLLSLVIWPQALQRDTCVGIVLYLASTEVTSLFVNVRWLLSKANLDGKPVYIINGVGLVLSFLVVRILPIPWLLWTLYSGCQHTVTWLEFVTAWLTVPIPALLNLYWFSFVVRGVVEAVLPRQPQQQEQPLPCDPLADSRGAQETCIKKAMAQRC